MELLWHGADGLSGSTAEGAKPLRSHPASWWALASGYEMFAAAKGVGEPASIFSPVNLAVALFFLERCAHPFPPPWPEQDITTISRQSFGVSAPSFWRKIAGKICQPSSCKYGKGEVQAFLVSS